MRNEDLLLKTLVNDEERFENFYIKTKYLPRN